MINLLFYKIFYFIKTTLIFPQTLFPSHLYTYYVDPKTGLMTWNKSTEHTDNEVAKSQLPQTYLQKQQSNLNNIENLAEKLDLNNDEVQGLWTLYNFDIYILMDDSGSMNVAGKTNLFQNKRFISSTNFIFIFQTIITNTKLFRHGRLYDW